MNNESKFEVYFLSADILELIKNGATDIKISGTMKHGESSFEIAAEGINTNSKQTNAEISGSGTRSVVHDPLSNTKKFPCPMPCSTINN